MLRSKYLIYLLLLSSLFGAKYLAVIDLEAEGISESEAKILTQRLTSKMIELSDYTIVERANIDKILKEQKFQHSGCTDSECAVEIGQLLNADLTIVGTASKFGRTYTLDCRIINVENGEALQSASYTHKGEIDELVKDGIESIAHKLLGLSYEEKISGAKTPSGYGATLEILSDPSGAEIYIGGNKFDNTPATLENFPAGDWEVVIRLEGYKQYTKTVKVAPNSSSQIKASLTYLPTNIAFDGTPDISEVEIKIDGVSKTLTSYNKKISVVPGLHTVTITGKEHSKHSETVNVKAGQTYAVKYNLDCVKGYLELLKETGSKFKPKDEIVRIDGVDGKRFNLMSGNRQSSVYLLDLGSHYLTIDKKDYETYQTKFEITPCQTKSVSLSSLIKKRGELTLSVTPPNAIVKIKGDELKVPEDYSLEYGKHELLVSASDYFPKLIPIEIYQEQTSLSVDLVNGKEYFAKMRKQKKLGFITTAILATAFLAEYIIAENSYQSYIDASTPADAQAYRSQSEMYSSLQTPTALALGLSTGFSIYTTISFNYQKKKLSFN